ncbi:MAG: radical SAM protein [Theionarchaea archaeon]|nr:radical SAM protein [Theionarchaea archaeon]MBU7019538.1 radical SAM protein [Theionarchaea archaeon]
MKESVYNVYLLDEVGTDCIVYNVMHRSLLRIDSDVYQLMRCGKIDCIDDEFLQVLRDQGTVVDDDLNELDMLKIRFNRIKYNAASRGFTIIPTHACNLACTYCYQGHGEVLSSTMDEKTIERTIEFIKKNVEGCGGVGVNFYGGEPLLVPDIVFGIAEKLKHFANESGIDLSVSFTSNGTLITEEIIEKFKDYNCRVQITFCGPKEIHDTMRIDKKGTGTYEKLIRVLTLLRKHEIAFHIRVDVDQRSLGTVGTLLQDLNERGLGGLGVAFCPISRDICYTEPDWNSKEVNVRELALLCRMAQDMGFKTAPVYIHNFVEKCSALPDSYFVIDPHGDVYKCIAASNFPEHRLGTLNEKGDIVDMNYTAYCMWTLRDPSLIEECATCKFAPICGGGCALAAYEKSGSINAAGCKEKELGEIVRTIVMLRYPELFKEHTYETVVL